MATILSRKPGGSGGGGGGAPSGPAGGDLTGTYPNPDIAANAVGAPELADNAVDTNAIQAGAVTAAKVAADVATQAELDAHINDPTDAHDASAISFAPTATIAATDVQAAIVEAASEAASRSLYQYVVLT